MVEIINGHFKKQEPRRYDFFHPPPFKPAEKWCPYWGKTPGVSGEIGATNACTRMYRLAFIAEHGLRSYKAVLAPPVPGARVERPQYGHHYSDEGLVWGGIFGSFCCCRQKGLAHVLNISYGVMKALVCEILFSH